MRSDLWIQIRGGVKGQALVELAVFGAIALAALGFLIRVGMKMNYDQEIRMAAFRRALAVAHADNGTDQDAVAVLYHYMADRQMPNPSDGFMAMGRVRTESSAYVAWGDNLTYGAEHLRATQPLVAIRLNDREREYRMEDLPHDGTWAYEDEDGSDAAVSKVAFRSLVSQSEVSNSTTGSVSHSAGGSGAGTTTTTQSWVDVNTVDGDRITSSPLTGGSGGF